MPYSLLVFDAETKAPGPVRKGEEGLPGVKYAASWQDWRGFGVGCVCVYDALENRYRVFLEDNRDELAELLKARRVIAGFNSVSFDAPLLEAVWNMRFPPSVIHYDLAVEMKRAARLNVNVPVRGWNLEAIAQANLGVGKARLGGAQAAIAIQRGQLGGPIDYCLRDVEVTWRLIEKTLRHENLLDPRNLHELCVAPPDNVETHANGTTAVPRPVSLYDGPPVRFFAPPPPPPPLSPAFAATASVATSATVATSVASTPFHEAILRREAAPSVAAPIVRQPSLRDTTRCQHCGINILWATYAKTGKKSPLIPETRDKPGAWVVSADTNDSWLYEAAQEGDGRRRYNNHLMECPGGFTSRRAA